jgi:diguanylate cyclase
VSLSRRQFKYPQLLDRLAELLSRMKVPQGSLRLEISETVVNEDPEYSASILRRMVDLGIGVVLDNFGIGLASMNHFLRLPIDLVKVDRGLVSHLPVSGRQAAILKTIFDVGRLLQVRMLAAGVERQEQLEALRKYGCDLVQGDLFSPAVPWERAQLLAREGRWPEALDRI